ncbi:MAG: serine hydrolase domain-containing protein [Kibdelosporangium sp.]
MNRHQPSRRSLLALLGAAPLVTGSALASPGISQADTSHSDRVARDLLPGGTFDQFVAQLAAEDKFSGTVLLVHRGRTVLARSHGMANEQLPVPNGPDTIFSLGSITKLFTAVAVAQLAQAGKVAYHEKVGTYLDGFPPEIAGGATVHHLLTHGSGLADYMQSDGFWVQAPNWSSTEEVWNGSMAFVRKAAPTFTPGTGYLYSNTGYHILGAIVAQVSGQSYYDYVRDNIFRTARMNVSGFYTTPQWRDDARIARPYVLQPSGERVDGLDRHIFIGSPAGGALANAPDLVRFADALLGGKLLDRAYTELTLSAKMPRRPMGPPGTSELLFGTYAPAATLVDDQWVLWHNGGAPGVSTHLDMFPHSGWTAVTLRNYDSPMGQPEPVAAMARRLIIAG